MGKVKRTLTKYIPRNIKIILHHCIYRSYNAFSLKSILLTKRELSDFFVWSPEFDSISFVAENIYSLINGKEENIKHSFYFYSPGGNLIKEYEVLSKDIISRIKLPFITNEYKYISFVHFTSSKSTFKNFIIDNVNKKRLKLNKQSRGYTLYKKNNSSITSCVHGNFGGISKEKICSAKQRSIHIYTPIYNFVKESFYDLVFNNPTSEELNIKIKLFSNDYSSHLKLPPMGTAFFEIKDYTGGVSFESKLPICRPVIFKNNLPNKTDFDVFHG